jgi:hypothetical protein
MTDKPLDEKRPEPEPGRRSRVEDASAEVEGHVRRSKPEEPGAPARGEDESPDVEGHLRHR